MRYLAGVTTLELREDKCTGCGMCTVVCPHAVLAVDNGRARIQERDACMECGACMRNCPEDAIAVQAGVGCAQAVINTALGRKATSCCSLADYETPGLPGGPSASGGGCGEAPQPKNRSGCC